MTAHTLHTTLQCTGQFGDLLGSQASWQTEVWLCGKPGIRPKISGPGEKNADFLIQGPTDHGVAGLVNLFGIESPGLTASLSIGDHVAKLLES